MKKEQEQKTSVIVPSFVHFFQQSLYRFIDINMLQLQKVNMRYSCYTDMSCYNQVEIFLHIYFDSAQNTPHFILAKQTRKIIMKKTILLVLILIFLIPSPLPPQTHVVVLEEEVILAPDFLHFMAQCLDPLDKDPTLAGVSAFNENGQSTIFYILHTFSRRKESSYECGRQYEPLKIRIYAL